MERMKTTNSNTRLSGLIVSTRKAHTLKHHTHTTNYTHIMKNTATNPANQPLLDAMESRRDRSAWEKGVTLYAFELVESCEETLTRENCNDALLNGTASWGDYSYGGSSLIYDADIAERLCNPSELNRCKGGDRNPNAWETWLDCQSRALGQAAARIRRAIARSSETIIA
jgi:hypothetical protein